MHQNRCLTSKADGAFDLGLYFRNYDILSLDGLDLLCGNGIEIIFKQPGSLIHLGLLQDVADETAVAEIVVLPGLLKNTAQLFHGICIKANALAFAHHLGNSNQLVCIVICKGNMESDTGTQTGVLLNQVRSVAAWKFQ